MKKTPKLFIQINENEVFNTTNKNFKDIVYEWFNVNLFWLHHSYKIFNGMRA